jgi:ABC-type dipeptide/oligopeptide/nickel transport system permease component
MSKRVIGLVLSLIISIAIGVLAAQRFFELFDKTVPAGSMTDLVRAGTHTAYLFAGCVFGVVIFGWTTLAAWLARFFPAAADTDTVAPRPPGK